MYPSYLLRLGSDLEPLKGVHPPPAPRLTLIQSLELRPIFAQSWPGCGVTAPIPSSSRFARRPWLLPTGPRCVANLIGGQTEVYRGTAHYCCSSSAPTPSFSPLLTLISTQTLLDLDLPFVEADALQWASRAKNSNVVRLLSNRKPRLQ